MVAIVNILTKLANARLQLSVQRRRQRLQLLRQLLQHIFQRLPHRLLQNITAKDTQNITDKDTQNITDTYHKKFSLKHKLQFLMARITVQKTLQRDGTYSRQTTRSFLYVPFQTEPDLSKRINDLLA